jgi:hypothetical protein
VWAEACESTSPPCASLWRMPPKDRRTKAVASVRTTYTPRPDATPEAETAALSQVYAYVLRKHQEKQKGTRPGAPDDAKGGFNNDPGATTRLP